MKTWFSTKPKQPSYHLSYLLIDYFKLINYCNIFWAHFVWRAYVIILNYVGIQYSIIYIKTVQLLCIISLKNMMSKYIHINLLA